MFDLLAHFGIPRADPRRWQLLYQALRERHPSHEAFQHHPSKRIDDDDETSWSPIVESLVLELPIPGFKIRYPNRVGGRRRIGDTPYKEKRFEDMAVVYQVASRMLRNPPLNERKAARVAANIWPGKLSAEQRRKRFRRALVTLPLYWLRVIGVVMFNELRLNPPELGQTPHLSQSPRML
jgi:hypothetical protein